MKLTKREAVGRHIKRVWLPKANKVATLVHEGGLTKEEAQQSLAGALLKIWDAHDYQPVSSIPRHDLAMINAEDTLEAALDHFVGTRAQARCAGL